MSEMFVSSLRNRIRAMNTIWERAVSDMTLEQVNHHEREGVLPIAFSLSHYIRAQDQSVSRVFLGEPEAWVSGGWAAKIGVSVDRLGREESVEEMEHIRFADFDAWRAYQSEVIARTDRVLEGLTEERLAEVVLPQLPPNMQQIFCAIVIGPGAPLRRLDVLECFVYQHGLRHMGEIEHGRALVGLRGMTS
ncbi:MAG: DinB family protein [Dehalococcoidia bacterium]